MNKFIKFILSIFVISGTVFMMDASTAQAGSDLEIKVEKSVSVRIAGAKGVKVKVYYRGKDVTEKSKLSYSSSNKSIVKVSECDDYDYDYIGFEARAKKAGKSTVTITAGYDPLRWGDEAEEGYGGEISTATAQCVVRSKYYSSIYVRHEVTDYNKRSNILTFKVYNISNKKIKIMSAGAGIQYNDCTSDDAKVRLAGGKSSVTIKPGQTKKVKFKILGDPMPSNYYNDRYIGIYSYWKWGNKRKYVSLMSDGSFSIGHKDGLHIYYSLDDPEE